jgi:hypothetical protein
MIDGGLVNESGISIPRRSKTMKSPAKSEQRHRNHPPIFVELRGLAPLCVQSVPRGNTRRACVISGSRGLFRHSGTLRGLVRRNDDETRAICRLFRGCVPGNGARRLQWRRIGGRRRARSAAASSMGTAPSGVSMAYAAGSAMPSIGTKWLGPSKTTRRIRPLPGSSVA